MICILVLHLFHKMLRMKTNGFAKLGKFLFGLGKGSKKKEQALRRGLGSCSVYRAYNAPVVKSCQKLSNIIERYQTLSNVVKHCQMLSNVVISCHKLS